MSHADTIRAEIRHTAGRLTGSLAHPSWCKGCAADASLDALVAENQQLRDALESEIAVLDGYVAGCCRDERRFCDEYGCSTIREIAGVLRAALDGTPSAAQTLEDA